MSKRVILDGKLVSVFDGSTEKRNLLFNNGKLVGLGYVPDENEDELEQINAKGQYLLPNVTDLGANLREPGGEGQETIKSGTRAAKNGGVSSVICSPCSDRPIDSPEAVSHVLEVAAKDAAVRVLPLGSVTKGCEGEELAELGLMKKAGAVGFSLENTVFSDELLKNALVYAGMLDMAVIVDPNAGMKKSGAVMNAGAWATMMGVKGVSGLYEEKEVGRAIQIFSSVGKGRLHIQYVSTAGSVELIRQAKERGVAVTCGTAPYYFMLTESAVAGYNSGAKLCPALRSEVDRQAVLAGVKDGTIDVIGSQHLPSGVDDKRADFVDAAFGASGLDYFVPLLYDFLVVKEGMNLADVLGLISKNVYGVLGLKWEGCGLQSSPGITVLDPRGTTRVSFDGFCSKGVNSPVLGVELSGKIWFD